MSHAMTGIQVLVKTESRSRLGTSLCLWGGVTEVSRGVTGRDSVTLRIWEESRDRRHSPGTGRDS